MPRRPNTPCTGGCGKLLWPSKNPAVQVCHECRRNTVKHGTTNAYIRKGCRCDDCRAAVAAKNVAYAKRFKERTGRNWYREYRSSDAVPISRKVRLAIYDRDGWVCQLCDLPVDRDLHFSHRMAATLDHIECQSWALIPDHSESNLRLAHRSCNAARGNRSAA